jgi:hypothetical protein
MVCGILSLREFTDPHPMTYSFPLEEKHIMQSIFYLLIIVGVDSILNG